VPPPSLNTTTSCRRAGTTAPSPGRSPRDGHVARSGDETIGHAARRPFLRLPPDLRVDGMYATKRRAQWQRKPWTRSVGRRGGAMMARSPHGRRQSGSADSAGSNNSDSRDSSPRSTNSAGSNSSAGSTRADGKATGTPNSPWGQRHCPDCRAALDGGPIRYHCWSCARAWYAADVETEIERTVGAASAASPAIR
jgi:hypothetical protein